MSSIDWKTWSPFQSADVREICAHLTAGERSEAAWRGGLYGIWVFATFAGPVSFAIAFRHPALIALAAGLAIVHLVCIPIWQRSVRRFLCSTAWAREQGYDPERLQLLSFRGR
jgi:hypothetical protein